jgi:Uma2 family endonuclease
LPTTAGPRVAWGSPAWCCGVEAWPAGAAGSPADEHDGRATVEDIWFLIEVADSSLPFDLGTKLPLYARSGIQELWVVDVDHEVVRQFADPHDGHYGVDTTWSRGTIIRSNVLTTVTLVVDDILRWRTR